MTKNSKKSGANCEVLPMVQKVEAYYRARDAFREGNYAIGMKETLLSLASGAFKLNARNLYELWEASIEGGRGSDELFLTMIDQGFVEQILIKAKTGKIEIINEFLAAVQRIEISERERILRAVV